MTRTLRILSIIVLASLINLVKSQSIWVKQFGGTMAEKGNAVKVDGSGNVYSIGTFSGTCDFDPSSATFTLTSSGNQDVFISKLDASGNFVFAKKFGGTSAEYLDDLAFDASGNIYLIGEFSTTVDFDPGTGTFNMTAPGTGTDIFVCKLDMNGNFIWAKQMGSPWWDSGNSIAIDGSGNVVITGDFATTSAGPADFDPGPGTFTFTSGTGGGNTDIFISKLTSAGNFVWAKQIGGINGDFGNSLEVDNSNNIIVGGYFTGTADFDPNAGTTNLVSLGMEDIYILKLDASGNFIWARNMGSNTVDYCKSIALDASGNVYSTGSFRGTADFDPSASSYTLASVAGDDIFISKLDASGNFVWAKSMGSTSADVANTITTDATGNIYTTGVFRLSMDVDPSLASYSLTTLGNGDVFIHKLNSAGNFLWAGQFGGTNDDFGNGIAVDAAGSLYTTGYFNATCDFDPSVGSLNLTSIGQTDAFVQKMCQTTAQPGTINGPVSICANAINNYTVTPVAGATLYNWNLPSGWIGTSSTNTINTTCGNSGLITITAANACGVSIPQTLSVTVNALPTVVSSISNSMICSGQSATLIASGATSYSWSTGASTQIIIVSPTLSTNYTVTGTDANTCQNTSTLSLTVSACTGVNSLTGEKIDFNLYPNPTNGIVILNVNEEAIGGQIRAFNALGEMIFSYAVLETKTKLDLSQQPVGIYFIVLKSDKGSVTRKIIKE
ncbi:MAG: T9SS type A sorting domain-containing protein [Sphingobacteriaceae bacterium]|nr:T9SS type A sorting domain-containing protein [Sphingobacteriaceae bacterium]